MTGIAYDDNGEPVPVAMPAENIGDACPHCGKSYADEPGAGQAAPVDLVALLKAHELGRADGQRELLAALFKGSTTGQEIVERAAMLAFAETWQGDCPLSVADLAAFLGVSSRTAARRASAAKLAGRFADE